jgi:tRNA-splicing ligase RtcB (3'-phosphate/5'-hydroxy nucleic acid ligase)
MDDPVRETIERVSRAEDVVRIAVMPDVHLAGDVCVGTAMATRRLVYPSAVGGDIGCGMLAMGFNASGDLLQDAERAGNVLRLLGERIPARRRNRSRTLPYPPELAQGELSHPSLQSLAADEGKLQFGTLGGGNHFIEIQADESNQLWVMIHSGSRAVGQAVKDHHVGRAMIRSVSMVALDAGTAAGLNYLRDQDWARRYAAANRNAMGQEVAEILRAVFKFEQVESLTIGCDHNHVQREMHFGESLLVHRKGAMPADLASPGVVPGSMGTASFHVEGRGCAESLHSSAHGAGRLLSRHAARERFSRADLRNQMQGVWFDPRLGEALREESPKSYKDVYAVMRAQRELVKITRTLRPLLVYKGR